MIPLSVPYVEGNEWEYVKKCLDTGWISSAGAYVNSFEDKVKDFVGAKYGIACMNGTAGLHVAQILLGIGENDHVLAPNITFVATLNAIKYSGATPILIDIDANNWQMDLGLLRTFLEEKTEKRTAKDGNIYSFYKKSGRPIKAIMPVHVLGNIGDVDTLIEITQEFNLEIIEDSTESLGSTYKGRHTGTYGKIGVFSFNGNKIISTGGGGVIVTNDEAIAERAKHITTTAKTSSLDYIHDEVGYNYRMVNVLAAIGVAQMEVFPEILDRKQKMDAFYRKNLKGVGDIEFQEVIEDVKANCWLFTFRTNKMRGLLKYLNDNGVQSRPFWMPMNQLNMYKDVPYFSHNDISSQIYESCISIPSSAGITEEQLQTTVDTIKEFYKD
jgi:aminotransferase in exopolysaccharide biosynthesis